MKKILLFFLLAATVSVARSQTNQLVGAWHWSDSSKQTHWLFDKDGNVNLRSGSKNSTAPESDPKKGSYELRNNKIIITWADEVEIINIRFTSQNSFEMVQTDPNDKRVKQVLIFKRVTDEEVKPDQ